MLQGDKDRIDKTPEAISAGNKKSSKANIIGEAPADCPQLDIDEPEHLKPLRLGF
jgi:hypothetical protein